MTPVETLQGMRDLLIEPAHWTTGSRARNARGECTFPGSKKAVCWCLVGAHQKVTGATEEAEKGPIYEIFSADLAGAYLQSALHKQRHSINPWSFNDLHTHPEIIALIDSALINAKKDTNV